jgi:hypothetical protein
MSSFPALANSTRALSLVLILLGLAVARADDGSGADAFSEQAKSEFNSLLRFATPERNAYWRGRQQDALEKYLAKFKELQATSEMLARQPNGRELTSVFSYEYLNTIRELQLKQTTSLVDDLGRELLNFKATTLIMPHVTVIEAQIAAWQASRSIATFKARWFPSRN